MNEGANVDRHIFHGRRIPLSAVARGYAAVIAAATLWGLSGATAKYLFARLDVEPFLLVQIRMALSFALLVLALRVIAPGLLRIQRRHVPFLLLWGTLGMAMVQFTYFQAIAATNVATAIFLQYLAPIFTALYAWLFERQRLGNWLLLCLGLAMGGSILLLFGGTDTLLVSPLGLIAGLASALFMSFYTIYGAKRVDQLSPWTLLCYGLGAGTLLWVLVDLGLWIAGRPVPVLALFMDTSMWGFFLYIAALATVVPFGLYLVGLQSLSPTQATLTGMLEPVLGGIFAFILLGESLTPGQLAGGGLIILAVILLQSRQQTST